MFFKNRKWIIYSKNRKRSITKVSVDILNITTNTVTKDLYTIHELFKGDKYLYNWRGRIFGDKLPNCSEWDFNWLEDDINQLKKKSNKMLLDLCNNALKTNDCKFIKRCLKNEER